MPARRAPRHHLTMSKEHAPLPRPKGPAARRRGAASGGRARPGPRRPHLPATGKRGLVGLGRLERPTSRLSGVRSNQLSYRPERHPAGPGTRAARAGRCPNLVTAGPHGPTVVCEGTCRRRRAIFTPGRSIKTDRMDLTCMPGACTRRWGPRQTVERARRQQVPPAQVWWGTFRKEVIQPQVPLRLPCYDFTPVADPTVDACPPCGLAQRLRVEPTPMV